MTIFQVLHESDLPLSEKTVERVSEEGSEMFAAAGTTARIMTSAIFHLHERPATLQILREELEKAIPDADDIPSVKLLEGLPYMVRNLEAATLRVVNAYYTRMPLSKSPCALQHQSLPDCH